MENVIIDKFLFDKQAFLQELNKSKKPLINFKEALIYLAEVP